MKFLPILTNLHLKNKRIMLYLPMGFVDLSIDCAIDTGALSSANSEADSEQFKEIAPQKIMKRGPFFSNDGGHRRIGNTYCNN